MNETALHKKDIGYKKPPQATQFKKGQSGNPSGRPRGSKNNKKVFEELAATIVEGKHPNGQNKFTLREGVISKLMSNALAGDPRAISKFIDTMEAYDAKNEASNRDAELAAMDEIFANYQQAQINAIEQFDDKEIHVIVRYMIAVEVEFAKLRTEIGALFDKENAAKRDLIENAPAAVI